MRVFRVRRLSCPSPRPNLKIVPTRALPLQPNTQNVPTWACSLCSAASLPSPALSPPPGHKKYVTRMCFSCSAALLPHPLSPVSQHKECAHMGTFFVLGCLPT